MRFKHNSALLINKGFYNRYAADIWMWIIFFEWIQKCIIYYDKYVFFTVYSNDNKKIKTIQEKTLK